MSLSLFRIDRARQYEYMFIIFGFINAVYCSIWDVAMDWSLGNFYAPHKMLREMLALRKAWFYYAAIVIDVVLRFNWIFYAIFINDIQHSAFLSFVVSLSEIFRRGVWTILRVENEHCTNVNLFRALRDIPLPYQLEEHTLAENIDAHPSPRPRREAETEREEQESHLAEHPTDSTPYSSSILANDIDVESSAIAGKTPLALRARRPTLSHAMSRFGTLVATAHSHDFQRRRVVDPLSGETTTVGLQYMDNDSTDEDDDDVDDDHDNKNNNRDEESGSNETAIFSEVDLPSQTTLFDSSKGRID